MPCAAVLPARVTGSIRTNDVAEVALRAHGRGNAEKTKALEQDEQHAAMPAVYKLVRLMLLPFPLDLL